MTKSKINSPLLGYNTNVKHAGEHFHIQTEDSGIDHPHIITHLFSSGTILATKKTSYKHLLENKNWDDEVRQLMKDQHKTMFVELRDGAHDAVTAKILGRKIGIKDPFGAKTPEKPTVKKPQQNGKVQVIAPASMNAKKAKAAVEKKNKEESPDHGFSIFETPDDTGTFGESLISDKSLDEVIMTYLKDELEE